MVVAEQLPPCFFMIADAVFFNEVNEVGWREPAQCRFAEVGIVGQVMFRPHGPVREVTASPAGDQDFFPGLSGMLQKQYGTPALSGSQGAHESGRARADDDDLIVFFD